MLVEPHDQAYFLRLYDRLYPEDYMAIRRVGGYEMFQAMAKLGERVSLAIVHAWLGALLFSATGGALASGVVELYREDASAGAITILAGSRVGSLSERLFSTQANVVFGAVDLGPHSVPVVAVAFGYEYNLPGQVITAAGETLEGEIKEIRYLSPGSGFDPALKVRQLLPTSGGAPAQLDGLGNDLGVPRQVEESDGLYLLRIRAVPNAVSPVAILAGVNSILATYGLRAHLHEVGTPSLPGFFYDAGSSADSPQIPERNFAYDMDPVARPFDEFKGYFDELEMRGFFLLGVPAGLDPSVYKSIWAMVDGMRAGGVGFDLVEEG